MIDSLISLPVLKSLGEYDLFKKEVVKIYGSFSKQGPPTGPGVFKSDLLYS